MELTGPNIASPRSKDVARSQLMQIVGRSYHLVERNLIAISVCGAVGMPLYYFIWHDIFPQPYENLTMRLIGAGMCLPFLLKDFWSEKLQKFAPIFWYATVLYVLPFFFTFMTLKNDFSAVWLASFIAALLLLVFLVDWLNLIFLSMLGMLLAWTVFAATGGAVSDPSVYLQLMPIVIFVLIVGTIFSYRSEMLKQERLDAMRTAGRNLSHELRSPLLGIRTSAMSLAQYLPLLLQTYELAEEGGLPVGEIPPAHRSALRHSLVRLQEETVHANTVVEMLLRNSGGVPIDPAEFNVVSMAECVKRALKRYPFKSEKERKLVKVQLTSDFTFYGSESAMIYVILSLLKTLLISRDKQGKGEVLLELTKMSQQNQLRFLIIGGGKPINRNYSHFFDGSSVLDSESGTGPALEFVRRAVEAFSGALAIEAVRGEHTEIVISLPSPVASMAAE